MRRKESLTDKRERIKKSQEYMNRVEIFSRAYKCNSIPICGILLLGCTYVVSEGLIASIPLAVLCFVLTLLLAVRVVIDTFVAVVILYYSFQSLRLVTYCRYTDEKRSIFCSIALKMMSKKGLGAELVCLCFRNGKRIGLYLPVLVEEG